tara:strand:- start:307 stop:648 length:342 start_codon:yes stop_codon:yes gene_type:complete
MTLFSIHKDCGVLYSQRKSNAKHSDIVCLDYDTPFSQRNDIPFVCIEHDIALINWFGANTPSNFDKMTIDYMNEHIIYDVNAKHKKFVHFGDFNTYIIKVLENLRYKVLYMCR